MAIYFKLTRKNARKEKGEYFLRCVCTFATHAFTFAQITNSEREILGKIS